ncbi:hypothetical protein E2562_027010 [Oryza meyeriana var. granulata]|uniref:Uncharacterized protein n=1 Tax=Oryza meyeriana var. granulata TaxID=110450 RepID=A0A6G1EPW5_9ORYZ|nr:hypothetical protein E2562_027010 [Oryza meyeriana var. granulata]
MPSLIWRVSFRGGFATGAGRAQAPPTLAVPVEPPLSPPLKIYGNEVGKEGLPKVEDETRREAVSLSPSEG